MSKRDVRRRTGAEAMRVAKWDNAKFILIYCVVLGHLAAAFDVNSGLLDGLHTFIYLFHMPAFLFLSGLLSKRSIGEGRVDKAMTYLVLYLFMKLFRFLVYGFILHKNAGFHLFEEDGVPWFALVLFSSYVLTMAIRSWKCSYALAVFVCLGMLAGYDAQLGSFLSAMRLLTFYPFFLAGYYWDTEKLAGLLRRRSIRAASALLLLAVLVICLYRPDFISAGFLKGKNSYEALGLLPFGGICRGIYYVVAMLLIVAVLAVAPEGKSVFSKWGKRSIQVYALHFPLIKVLTDRFGIEELCRGIWPQHYAVFVPVLALLLTVFLSLGIWEPFFNLLMNPEKPKQAA